MTDKRYRDARTGEYVTAECAAEQRRAERRARNQPLPRRHPAHHHTREGKYR